MGKTIPMAMFNGYVTVITRGYVFHLVVGRYSPPTSHSLVHFGMTDTSYSNWDGKPSDQLITIPE